MGLPLSNSTAAQYLAWEAQQPIRHEFYCGEIFAMFGATLAHNRVVLNLASALTAHLDGSSCQVFAESVKLKLGDDAILYPDLQVTCHGAIADDAYFVTDPILIIEVLSPTTSGYDKRDKFALYRTLDSLKQYVLIDPLSRRLEVFTRADAGTWLFTDETRADTLTLSSLECSLIPALIFKGVPVQAV